MQVRNILLESLFIILITQPGSNDLGKLANLQFSKQNVRSKAPLSSGGAFLCVNS